MTDEKRTTINLTHHEIQSGTDRQRHAEMLIEQLPAGHGGRNAWLLNYGVGAEAVTLRREIGMVWDHVTRAARFVIPAKNESSRFDVFEAKPGEAIEDFAERLIKLDRTRPAIGIHNSIALFAERGATASDLLSQWSAVQAFRNWRRKQD